MAKTAEMKLPVKLLKTGTNTYIVDASGTLVDKADLVRSANSFHPMLEALKLLLEDARMSLDIDGDCDHDVNICVCGLRANIEQADEAIKQAEEGKQ